MRISKSIIFLSILTGLFAVIAACAGLFYQAPGEPFEFTTLHGKTELMYGQGLYAFDTYFKAPILRGTDAVTLFAAVPLLAAGVLLYRRGSLRGGLLLLGALAYLLYNAISLGMGAAYNNLFLLYVAYTSTALFAFILTFAAFDLPALAAQTSPRAPRRGIAILMIFSGAALLVAWLGDILAALFAGTVPAIASYTTEVTYVMDLGVIAPTCIYAAVLLLRRQPLGILLGAMMLVTLAVVGLMVALQTVFQLQAGIELTVPEFIGKAGSFMLLALFAVGLLAKLFANVEQRNPDIENQMI